MVKKWHQIADGIRLKSEIRSIFFPQSGDKLLLEFLFWCLRKEVELPTDHETIMEKLSTYESELEERTNTAYRRIIKLRPLFKKAVLRSGDPRSSDARRFYLSRGWNNCLMSSAVFGRIPQKKNQKSGAVFMPVIDRGWNQAVDNLRKDFRSAFE